MRYQIILGLTLFSLLGCQKDDPARGEAPQGLIKKEIIPVEATMPDSTEVPQALVEKINMLKQLPKSENGLPGAKWYVVTGFGTFQIGDTVAITTREGKKGYPFLEPINGEYRYWILHNDEIVSVGAKSFSKNCKPLKK